MRLVIATILYCASVAGAQEVNPAYFSGMKWRSIGPARSGYIPAPAGIPGDPTTYYVGLPEGGVWKTTDSGTTWKPIFDQVHIASIGAVAVAPSDPTTVYVGTGNQSGWSFTTGKGMYKSTDAGKTWTSIGLTSTQYIGGIAVDPHNANNLLVAVNGTAAAPTQRGIYRSSDGGRSWNCVLPVDGSGASDIFLDYQDPQIAYALLPGGSGTGAYKSTDAGATWRPVGSAGLPDGARISAFAEASGTRGRRLYALAAVGSGRGAGPRALY